MTILASISHCVGQGRSLALHDMANCDVRDMVTWDVRDMATHAGP